MTIAIALPVITLVALLALCLVLFRRRYKRAQRLEDGTIWEHGPLIMVSKTTVVHTDARWRLLRKPTFRVPRPWRSSHEAATPALGVPTTDVPSARPSDEHSFSIHYECPTTDTNLDSSSRQHESDAGSSSYHTSQSLPDSGHESTDEYMSSSNHDIETVTPRLAVRIPQWPAWLPRWPSPSPELSRKASSSVEHSVSTHANDAYSHLKFQPPRVVRLEPSFLREYRLTHAHSDSTAPLIASAAPPGMSDATAPAPMRAPAEPSPLTHAREAQLDVTPSVPPNRISSISGSLRPSSGPPSLATNPSVSSSVIARFPGFDGDSQPTSSGSESLSRASTAPSEFAEHGRLPNPFASSASPWRTILSAVGEAAISEENDVAPALYNADGGGDSPGSPLPSLRSQHAFRAMPLHLEPAAEERPASAAASTHARTLSSATVPTLSSKPSYSASAAMTTPHSSYSPGGSALSART